MSKKNELKPQNAQKLAFFQNLQEIARSRNLEVEEVRRILEDSFIKTIQKKFDPDAEISLIVDWEQKDFKLVNANALVVSDEVFQENLQDEEGIWVCEISETEAKDKYDKNIKEDDTIEITIDFETLPKSVFVPVQQQFKQRISEIIRERVYAKYLPMKGQTIKAKLVSKLPSGFLYEIEEDGVNAFLPRKFSHHRKDPQVGIKEEVFIEEVIEFGKDAQIVISNLSNQEVKEAIKAEIPEIQTGEIVIERIARQEGIRSKVAIRKANDENQGLEEIGTIIGKDSSRINAISERLNGEKIDIIKYSNDINEFISSALSPARVISINEIREGKIKKYIIVVPSSHNTIAIGKGGSNVSLAAEITREKLDIISYEEAKNRKLTILWNGNVKDEEEINLLNEERKNNSRPKTYFSFNNNANGNKKTSSHKNNWMSEFESEIAKFKEDFDSIEENTPVSFTNKEENVANKKVKNFTNNSSQKPLDVDQIMEDALMNFDDEFENEPVVKTKTSSYTKEEMERIQKELEDYTVDNDLASYTGFKNFDFSGFNDADWDDEEEEE